MAIDWLNFTPWTSLAGGLLIGLAVAILLLFNGRIAGISGILGGLFNPAKKRFFVAICICFGIDNIAILF